ncbi:MAG TPA: hypothetical protein VKS99_09075, partial [Blastocatellia bacterium]|nr:hypothetical protein [Blastocatellia bacterium]
NWRDGVKVHTRERINDRGLRIAEQGTGNGEWGLRTADFLIADGRFPQPDYSFDCPLFCSLSFTTPQSARLTIL